VDNSAFGPKAITLSVEGMPGLGGTTTVEVFFPRDISFHAGGQPDSPNWFHYWMQARPNPNVVYNPALPLLGQVPGMLEWSYMVAPDKTRIEIGTENPTAGRSYGIGEFRSGIDLMIDTVIHEEVHVDQIGRADALMPVSSGGDAFRYGWSWVQSMHNHWNPGVDAEWGVAAVDDDGNGTIDDAAPMPPFEPGWTGSDDISLAHPLWPDWPNAWPLPVPLPGDPGLHPIEVEAIDEHDYWEHDWGDPGKQHRTNQRWDD
jgi:hypothetical protein